MVGIGLFCGGFFFRDRRYLVEFGLVSVCYWSGNGYNFVRSSSGRCCESYEYVYVFVC